MYNNIGINITLKCVGNLTIQNYMVQVNFYLHQYNTGKQQVSANVVEGNKTNTDRF